MPTGLCGSQTGQYLQPLDKYQPEIARSTRRARKIASTEPLADNNYCSVPAASTVLAILFALRRSHSCGDLIRQEIGHHRFSLLVEVTGAVDVDGVGDVVENGRCQHDAARFQHVGALLDHGM